MQVSDVEINAKIAIRTKQRLNQIISYTTGKSYKQVEKDTDRDNYMTADLALEYGLIDKVIGAFDQRKEMGAIK